MAYYERAPLQGQYLLYSLWLTMAYYTLATAHYTYDARAPYQGQQDQAPYHTYQGQR